MIESEFLERLQGFVAGSWRSSGGGAALPVVNPSNGEVLAHVPDMGAAESHEAIESAERARQVDVPDSTRRAWLAEIARLLLAGKSELARIITLEQGKPLKESLAEVEYAAGFFEFYSGCLDHLAPKELPKKIRGLSWTIHRRPAGVAGLITPWNFPLAMLAKKLAAAIAAGCASVTKPSELTPLSCIALWHLLDRVELDAGRANLVIGRPASIGEVLCAHPAVRVISFTGSTAVGKLLTAQCSAHVKRLSLELGGNAPFVVMDDANLNQAIDALLANKFRCAGQTCVCANRVLVQRGVEAAFVEAIADRVSKLRVGDGLDSATDIGPLINRAAFDKVARHVEDARLFGARLVHGGDSRRPDADWGAFYTPTVITGTNPSMMLWREETFGPVVAIGTFDSEEQALEMANGTPFGLAAYLFTRDESRAGRMISKLRFGHVGLNTGMGPTPEAPFGGMKQSGHGREGGVEGLMEFVETQVVAAA